LRGGDRFSYMTKKGGTEKGTTDINCLFTVKGVKGGKGKLKGAKT